MPVPQAENYQPGAPGPADDISPQKFFEGMVGRGVDEFKSNWQFMKTADPMVSSVRGIIDPQGLAQDRTQMAQGLAPLVGAGGDNAPGVGESWTNVGKDAISYDEWKDGNPVKAGGQNAIDVIGAMIGGRGINNAARAPERAITQGATEAAIPAKAPEAVVPSLPKPIGQWGPSNETFGGFSKAYQEAITGRPISDAYLVDGVKFDGYPNGVLTEVKGQYAQFVNKETGQFQTWWKGSDAIASQARRQLDAAKGSPVQWIVAEPQAAAAFQELFNANGISGIIIKVVPMPGPGK
ncbi:Tox-REase-5 domain-containing protein [Mycobacteroides abscessus]|uniref:Tox-REase-5 domain-containing protein n=2 Tax=Mycobacteroides abscessus TaxID=36809 RepID=UPI00311AB658